MNQSDSRDPSPPFNDPCCRASRMPPSPTLASTRTLSTAAWDTVLSQIPTEGEMMPYGSVVQVVLSGGSVTLPDFVGMTRQEALFQIQQLQLNLTEIREIPVDDASQYERVAAQFFSDEKATPYAVGEQAMLHTQVTLAVYVSNQPAESPSPEPTEIQETAPEATP